MKNIATNLKTTKEYDIVAAYILGAILSGKYDVYTDICDAEEAVKKEYEFEMDENEDFVQENFVASLVVEIAYVAVQAKQSFGDIAYSMTKVMSYKEQSFINTVLNRLISNKEIFNA